MLRHRVIPVVLLDGYSVLKTIGFDVRRNLGNPITVARVYNSRNVDELILLDIDASKEKRHIDYFTIEKVASECFMPLSVGGGLKSCEEIEKALKKGADKVVINTGALISPELVDKASSEFGSQCIIVSIDVEKIDDRYRVYSHAGLAIDMDAVDWCIKMESLGAGEIFLNNVDLDGKMCGYDIALAKKAADAVNIPVIFCGGAAHPDDCARIVKSGVSAAAASSMFHFTHYTPDDCRLAMKKEGIPVREGKIWE